ncbi:hypothetical protein MLD52_17760 [Puniceicoccaceae bacterium K14]|nr:hypothetical protein [Puniceicoccaceae bacterium K14]
MTGEKIRKIEVITIAVSVFAFFVSLGSLYFTWEQRNRSQQELIVASINPRQLATDSVVLRKFGFPGFSWTMQSGVPVLISNIGDRSVSIVGYELLTSIGDSGLINHSYLDGGLCTKEGSEYPLPITLAPGESEYFILYLGKSISPDAMKVIKDDFPLDEPVSYNEITEMLFDSGLDHLGNTLEVFSHESSGRIVSWPNKKDIVDQVFYVVWKTGRGNTIKSMGSTIYPVE